MLITFSVATSSAAIKVVVPSPVVVGVSFWKIAIRRQWEQTPIQRRALAFLSHEQNQGLIGRVKVQANNVSVFTDDVPICR